MIHDCDIPDEVWYTDELEGHGKLYRVEHVLSQWPCQLPDDDEVESRLRKLRRGIDRSLNPLGIGQMLYLVLDKTDKDYVRARRLG